MTPAEVQTLIDYNYWARDRLLDAIVPLSRNSSRATWAAAFVRFATRSPTCMPPSGSGISAGSENRRRDCHPPIDFPISPQSSRPGATSRHRSAYSARSTIAGSKRASSKSPAGVLSASMLWQTLQHVVNHQSYHRGQITTMLRQMGATPAKAMDLMAFYRERSAPTA